MKMPFSRKYLFHIILITFIFTLIFSFTLQTSQFYQSARLKALDLLYLIQRTVFHTPKEVNQFVIIALDDNSINMTDKRWPWERRVFADIIRKLNAYKPSLICLDFTVTGESTDKENDLSLAVALGEKKNIILTSYYDSNANLISPLEEFSKSALSTGFVNKINDIDGTVRRFYPFHKNENNEYNNFAVELRILSSLYNKKEIEIVSKLPLLSDDSLFINYLAKPEDFNAYPLTDVFGNKIPPDFLKNKVILFGSTTEIIHDVYPTPFGYMPGVYIIANSLITIMSDKFLTGLNHTSSLLIYIVIALILGLLIFRYGIRRGILIAVFSSLLCLAVSSILFFYGLIFDWFSAVFIIVSVSIVIAFYRYITILKINMEDLRKANTEIKNAQNEIIRREQLSTIGKMTSKIIHELNNPIGNLTDCIEMLKEKIKDTGEISDLLNLAHKEVTRAKRIGEDLKTSYTSHIEDKVNTDINKLIMDIVELSRQNIKSKGLDIKLGLDNKLPLVPASPDKIKQVFLNMIINAVDAVGKGGSIYITTKPSKDTDGSEYADIIIKDEGCGIPEDELGKIFNAFYTMKKHKKGSGLGLFISDEIIKAHKGRISVESKIGRGTVFTIKLPIKEQI